MLIDWFTVAAQALNFIILVALLKHFLYRPILAALDAREQKIAAELADAAHQKTAAIEQRELFQQKNGLFDQQRKALFEQALQAANAERLRLFAEARSAAESFQTSYRATLLNDAQNLNQAISQQTHQAVFAIVRQVLADLASANFEDQLIQMFANRLQALDNTAKASLLAAINSVDALVVRSAFTLTAEQCTVIQQALESCLATPAAIRFETAPELISGIELVANGWKIAWSIADYIASLEQSVGGLLIETNQATAANSNAA